jgi:hypothetical protein
MTNEEKAKELTLEFRTKVEAEKMVGFCGILTDGKVVWSRAGSGPGTAIDLIEDFKRSQLAELEKAK